MNKVVRGIADFVRRSRPDMLATFQRLAQRQEPVALLVACSDSQIVSSLLLGTDPGDLFEVRTVGNLIAPADPGGKASAGYSSEAAAIEYALLALEVRHVIVLGHSGCGAMKAITSGLLPKGAPNLERRLGHARGAREKLERSPWTDPALGGPSLPGQCPPAARPHPELRARGGPTREGRSRAPWRLVRGRDGGSSSVVPRRGALHPRGRVGDRASTGLGRRSSLLTDYTRHP
jgi:carbonic anhydrase